MTAVIGRDEELASLEGLLSDAMSSRGGIAMVSGTVTIGKSTLLHTFAGRAGRAGAAVLTAVGSTAERGLPLGVFAQLLHDAELTAEEGERVARLLREGADASPEQPQTVEHMGASLVHDLCGVLIELSRRVPLLIVVDDVQYVDSASALCLLYLARRVRSARILAVFCQSDYPQLAHTPFQTELLRQPHSRRIRLTRLTREQVALLLTSAQGVQGTRSAADAGDTPGASDAAHARVVEYQAITGGNPLLVGALLDDERVAAAIGEPFAPGDGYAQAVLTCLRRGDPMMLRVARGLAVLGDASGLDRLLGLDGAVVIQVLRCLEAIGLLDGGGFRHPAAHEAVLADLTPELRAELHRSAAELTHHDGAVVTVVAEHLRAADHGDAPWVVPVLREAAEHSLREDRVAPAVDYLRLAHRACSDEGQGAAVRAELSRAEWRINPRVSTGHFEELTDAMRRGLLTGRDGVALAKSLLWCGRLDEAREAIEWLGGYDDQGDAETAVELRSAEHWLRASFPPFVTHLRRTPSGPAAEILPSVTVSRHAEAVAALATVLSRGARDDVIVSVEQILRSLRLSDATLDAVEAALLALVYAERPDKAQPWCDLFIEEAVSRRSAGWQARLSAIRAEIAMRQGDLPGAELYGRQALTLMPHAAWGVAIGGPLSCLLLSTTAMGRYDDAVEQLNRPVPDAIFQSRYGLHHLHARGRYSLAVDHAQAALRDFEACGELMGKWGIDVPGLISWRTDAAAACLRLGQHGKARRLAEEQLSRCGGSRTQGIALRLLAATSELRQRPALLRQAVDVLQANGDRYELARTLLDLTEAYNALGEYKRARMMGRRAWAGAQECQAEPLSRLLSPDRGRDEAEERAESRAGSQATSMLSDAERRVASLAAVGYTNREISNKLYITVSTVEQHLTRIYRKLSVTRRTDLPSNLELATVVTA
ncbi:AAA family ATPase [Microbispora sp. NPDC049125]|uniref:helix-turn-helix transcriptional regulator n=1 Tax=Microbispora sp. NPDC049125 TaxID=3154929 RepID=UPI0034662EA0